MGMYVVTDDKNKIRRITVECGIHIHWLQCRCILYRLLMLCQTMVAIILWKKITIKSCAEV